MRRGLALGACLTLAACEGLAHVDDYRVASTSGAADSPICALCPASETTIARLPCPSGAAGTSGETFVFATHDLTLGASATELADPAYDDGLDVDCSTRADAGLPGSCDPNEAQTPGLIDSPPWTPLPRGIDNALAQRVVAPLLSFAASAGKNIDLDTVISDSFTQGELGAIILVENWNGTPDDDDVQTAFVGASGTTAPPKWDGTDTWIPNAAVASYTVFPSYVSGGVLVADTRSAGEDDTTIAISSGSSGPITFTLKGHLVVRFGPITRDALTITTASRWYLSDALEQVGALAAFIGQGDATATSILQESLPSLLQQAADLPTGVSPTPGASCQAISTAMQGHAFRANVAPTPN